MSQIKEVKSVWGISEKGQREENFRERSPIWYRGIKTITRWRQHSISIKDKYDFNGQS